MKFLITLQESNYNDPIKGDRINIFGQSLSILTCSRLIKDLNSQYEIDIYAPKSILEDIEIPQTDLINIFKRDNKDFFSCLKKSAFNSQINDKNLVWINSRFIGIDFQEIKKALEYKDSNNIDLLMSSENNNFLVADKSLKILNLSEDKENKNLVFFDRNRLDKIHFFNKKFFIISKNKIDLLKELDNLHIDFFPFKSGLLIDSLFDCFSETEIANLFIRN